MELQAPPEVERAPELPGEAAPEEEPLEPIVLGTLVYLVDRGGPAGATLIPIAQREGEGYAPLPDPDETPDLIERFPVDRWEAGTEFVVFDQGVRAGLFTADGTSQIEPSLCLARAVGAGTLELRPEASERDRFLALRRADLDGPVPSALARHPRIPLDDDLRNASVEVARALIPRLSIPWPPTVPGIRRRLDPFTDGEGRRSLAASFVYGDELRVGVPEPAAYSLFLVSREEEDGFVPRFAWYQSQNPDGKAFPGFLAAHDLRGVGEPDLAIEIFGREYRGLAILGLDGGEWRLVHRDPCADEPPAGAFRTDP